MKPIVVLARLLIGVFLAMMLVSCGYGSVPEADSAQIEGVVRAYYDAFNSYDPIRVEAVFARRAWQEKGAEISAWVGTAYCMNLRYEFIAMESIKSESDSVWATVMVESGLGSGQDFINLVWEDGHWKIARLLTQKPVQAAPKEETPAGTCCPSGGS